MELEKHPLIEPHRLAVAGEPYRWTSETAAEASSTEKRLKAFTRKWYLNEMYLIVKGERKYSSSEWKALDVIASAKGWKKPGKRPGAGNRTNHKPKTAELTAELQGRLMQK